MKAIFAAVPVRLDALKGAVPSTGASSPEEDKSIYNANFARHKYLITDPPDFLTKVKRLNQLFQGRFGLLKLKVFRVRDLVYSSEIK